MTAKWMVSVFNPQSLTSHESLFEQWWRFIDIVILGTTIVKVISITVEYELTEYLKVELRVGWWTSVMVNQGGPPVSLKVAQY